MTSPLYVKVAKKPLLGVVPPKLHVALSLLSRLPVLLEQNFLVQETVSPVAGGGSPPPGPATWAVIVMVDPDTDSESVTVCARNGTFTAGLLDEGPAAL